MANLQICLDEIQIYVGTYKKYNEGSLFGKWMKISDYSDYEDLSDAMQELHKDEDDAELMFQDFEAPELFERMGLISESYLSTDIYEIIEKIENCSYDIEIISAYVDCFGYYCKGIDELIEKVEESYQGEYQSDEEFAEQLLTETCCIPENLPSYLYIDWERTARDIMFDYSTSNNYYFRCS